jgi:hypothetical protein
MYTTSTEPGRIKGSSSRFQSRKLDHRQQIMQAARSSPSRPWVDYTTIIEDVHERLHMREEVDV